MNGPAILGFIIGHMKSLRGHKGFFPFHVAFNTLLVLRCIIVNPEATSPTEFDFIDELEPTGGIEGIQTCKEGNGWPPGSPEFEITYGLILMNNPQIKGLPFGSPNLGTLFRGAGDEVLEAQVMLQKFGDFLGSTDDTEGIETVIRHVGNTDYSQHA